MSKIISNLKDDGECRGFSKVCLEYCCEVAKTVENYGGVTVFAGGDDLFALVPCEGKSGTVFSLIKDINNVFKDKFKDYIKAIETANEGKNPEEVVPVPSLSFGALICHEKYPLYEAVDKSGKLLFDVAKQKNGGKKNCVAVQVQKHSGQSEELLITKTALDDFTKHLEKIIGSDRTDSADEFLLSAAQKIIMFRKLINSADNLMIKNTFKNIFDAEYHLENSKDFLHDVLPKFYVDHCVSGNIILLEKDEEIKEDKAKTLGKVLRLYKFFIEKGEE